MSEERITQEELKVLAEYGRTMLSIQLFELTLTGLVQINQSEPPEKVSFDEAWKQVQPLFGMTAGQLRKELKKQGNVPDDLLDEIQIAVNTRNKLAPYYLLEGDYKGEENAERYITLPSVPEGANEPTQHHEKGDQDYTSERLERPDSPSYTLPP